MLLDKSQLNDTVHCLQVELQITNNKVIYRKYSGNLRMTLRVDVIIEIISINIY